MDNRISTPGQQDLPYPDISGGYNGMTDVSPQFRRYLNDEAKFPQKFHVNMGIFRLKMLNYK